MDEIKNMPTFLIFITLFCFFLPFVLLGVIFLFKSVFDKFLKNPKFFLLLGLLSSILNFIGMLINETMISRVTSAILIFILARLGNLFLSQICQPRLSGEGGVRFPQNNAVTARLPSKF